MTLVPPNYARVLHLIQKSAPEAILAGGAVRDLYHGKPVKDLDIFVHAEGADIWQIEELLTRAFPDTRRLQLANFSSCYLNTDCASSISFEIRSLLGPVELNVIHLNGQPTHMTVLRRMDFGICQIGVCKWHLFFTPEFVEDAKNKTFTVTRCDHEAGLERTLQRWERLREKYPEHTLINPFGDPDNYAPFDFT